MDLILDGGRELKKRIITTENQITRESQDLKISDSFGIGYMMHLRKDIRRLLNINNSLGMLMLYRNMKHQRALSLVRGRATKRQLTARERQIMKPLNGLKRLGLFGMYLMMHGKRVIRRLLITNKNLGMLIRNITIILHQDLSLAVGSLVK